MTTIIKDDFRNGASVSMDMDKEAEELFVFHFKAEGKGCDILKYPLDSYHMPIAWATYERCCNYEVESLKA